MKLNQIKADIRLRSTWEAVDLGFTMVQAWAKIIFIPWSIFAIVFASLLWLLVPSNSLWLAGILFWWSKPLYDRLLLHVASETLFSLNEPDWDRYWSYLLPLKKLPSLLFNNGLWSSLTYRRLSASRGLNLPIWQLEKLTGKKRKQRQSVLHTSIHNQAVWLTITCMHIEMIINLAFFGLIFLWLPTHMQTAFIPTFFLEENTEEINEWIELLSYSFYVISVIIMEPFYVLASFSLYLNRRTQLEAWDIELVFRQIATRLNKLKQTALHMSNKPLVMAGWVLISFTLLTVSPYQKSYAGAHDEVVASEVLSAEQSKPVIEKIMKRDDLSHTDTLSFWWFKDKDNDKSKNIKFEWFDSFNTIGKIISNVIESGLWLLLILLISLLIIYRNRWLPLFQGHLKQQDKPIKPDILFGMDIRPESLPSDIAEHARLFWKKGQQRDALSLLYRGSLAYLVNQDHILLKASHTEEDVIRLSRPMLQGSKEDYLERLTEAWKKVAYAHCLPSNEDAEYLFQHWKQAFDGASSSVKGLQ